MNDGIGHRGKRQKLQTGIYADRYGISAMVTVGPLRDEGRFPHGTPLDTIEAWRLRRRAELLTQRGRVGARGTLAADIRRFLAAMPEGRRKIDYDQLLRHWHDGPLGPKRRADVTEFDIRTQLHAWTAIADSTRRHRLRALRVLYRTLDGAGAANPARGIHVPPWKSRGPRALPMAIVVLVLAHMGDSAAKIRLRVMAWTGLPQMQLQRLRRIDVDFLNGRYRRPPRTKGGGAGSQWIAAMPQALAALRDYDAAQLWGPFSRECLADTWRRAIARTRKTLEATARETGDLSALDAFDAAIPPQCRPYDLRHSFLTEAYRLTGDLRAVAELAQHADLGTTRQYTEGAVSERAAAAIAAMTARWGSR
jgi:integrase